MKIIEYLEGFMKLKKFRFVNNNQQKSRNSPELVVGMIHPEILSLLQGKDVQPLSQAAVSQISPMPVGHEMQMQERWQRMKKSLTEALYIVNTSRGRKQSTGSHEISNQLLSDVVRGRNVRLYYRYHSHQYGKNHDGSKYPSIMRLWCWYLLGSNVEQWRVPQQRCQGMLPHLLWGDCKVTITKGKLCSGSSVRVQVFLQLIPIIYRSNEYKYELYIIFHLQYQKIDFLSQNICSFILIIYIFREEKAKQKDKQNNFILFSVQKKNLTNEILSNFSRVFCFQNFTYYIKQQKVKMQVQNSCHEQQVNKLRVFVFDKCNQLKMYSTLQVPDGCRFTLKAQFAPMSSSKESTFTKALNNQLQSPNNECKLLALHVAQLLSQRTNKSQSESYNTSQFDPNLILNSLSSVKVQEMQDQKIEQRNKQKKNEKLQANKLQKVRKNSAQFYLDKKKLLKTHTEVHRKKKYSFQQKFIVLSDLKNGENKQISGKQTSLSGLGISTREYNNIQPLKAEKQQEPLANVGSFEKNINKITFSQQKKHSISEKQENTQKPEFLSEQWVEKLLSQSSFYQKVLIKAKQRIIIKAMMRQPPEGIDQEQWLNTIEEQQYYINGGHPYPQLYDSDQDNYY